MHKKNIKAKQNLLKNFNTSSSFMMHYSLHSFNFNSLSIYLDVLLKQNLKYLEKTLTLISIFLNIEHLTV